ncbi:MAG: methionine--tRNA ligase [Thermoprotei archaeon]|nr:MAG: methionine--tRNA ligase [Thermoprotei archaeon]
MRKILVTAALPYANGELHIGHLKSTYIPADIYARYHRLKGNYVVFVCGSDQHGTPIEIAAREAGVKVEDYVDYWMKNHAEDFKRMNIEFDIFYKTHSLENIEMTKFFLKKLKENGFLYKKKVLQLYCKHDGMYLADRYVKGECPYCGEQDQYGDHCEACGATYEAWQLKNPKCILCGNKPEIKEEEHYLFKLSAFSEKLKNWIHNNPKFQKSVVKYVYNWLDSLRDWDITRENYWGIEMPFEDVKGKYVYVWFDAPIGYISATIKWAKENNRNWEEFWKNRDAEVIHFIGKDIVYHHYLFWPAMLIGVNDNFNLPSAMPTRGFLLLEGRKFSKSRKWYISIKRATEIFDPDYIRFYLTLITPYSLEDTDFKLEDFKNIVNSGLSDTIGNLIHRTLTFITKYFNSRIPQPGEYDSLDKKMITKLRQTPTIVGKFIEEFRLKTGLEEILGLARETNKYFNTKEPWKYVKKEREKAATTLFITANIVASLSVLLSPYTPKIAERIKKVLNLEKTLQWDESGTFILPPGHAIGKIEIIAPKITDEQIQKLREKLGIRQ